ncbi:MAG TPA: chemotaxis protein [Cyanobacteria bacterium UBA8803]|nr:chemotaxis protein [Cyanobacteria bacterium UBA9273]HBL59143.1 chemotaxis protein [Cyanobacteria bacterium UBA8803]
MMNVGQTSPVNRIPAYVPSQTQSTSWWSRLSLGTKATVLAVALSVGPAIGTGLLNYAVVNQTTRQEIQQEQPANNFSLLLLTTGVTALVAAGVAALLAKRAVEPILSTNATVQKLAAGELDTRIPVVGEDELAVLGSNINRMVDQVQTLLEEQKASVEQIRSYAETVNAASRGDKQFLFDRAVNEAKKQLNVDRVVIYGFEPDWSGSIVAEAVEPGWPRALMDKISDPCIPRRILEEYRKGRVVPTASVQQANFSTAHMQLLARLQVKANLVVPIVSGDILIGLLVAHQCAKTRMWQPSEIDYLKELATQIGLSLSSITLASSKAAEAERIQRWKDLTPRIRQSFNVEEILETAVAEVRGALHADRVLICRFQEGNSVTITAESVAPGWSKLKGQTLKVEGKRVQGESAIASQYHRGEVRVADNLDDASPTEWEKALLEMLSVKAYMIVPILREGKVDGLLCIGQCSKPRIWLDAELDLFSSVADQIGFALDQATLLAQQEKATFLAQELNEITSRIRESFKVEEIYDAATTGVRETLNTDRAIVYLFDENWNGTIVAESVGSGWPKALGANIADPCFADQYIEKYKRGRVKGLENIYEAGLSKCYLSQLEPFKVKANLVAPILAEGDLLGLLVTHQCSSTRPWLESEMNFLKQVATQVGFGLDQANLLEQREQARIAAEMASAEQRNQKESLQLQLLELLSDVEGAAQGDLTVRADVTVGEIGTVADFFNAVIESLREIVTKVKTAATQVNTSLGENEGAIRQLSLEALKQAEETTHTLESVERMTRSIQEVADNARSAAEVARKASTTAEAGGLAMDRSVQNILGLRATVAETAKKVKRLGESSQQISKVVSLINQIALQTNLLAINAGIEAARAGEEGQGFAVVAEEVGELAARSAAATREIEQIVENIQQETASVVEAMELGTSQVVEGTHLVEDAKLSLTQILDVSRQIDSLVQSISSATVSQAETSRAITELMKDMARISEHTSNSTRQVSNSLKDTVEIAEELQASVGAFKVGD